MHVAPHRPKVQARYSSFCKDVGVGDALAVGVERVPAHYLAVGLVEHTNNGLVPVDKEGVVAWRLEGNAGRGLEVQGCEQILHFLCGGSG